MNEHVAEIIAAFVKRNQVPASELPALIVSVSQSLAGLGQAPAAATVPAPLTPAVSIRSSVGAETITCLDCGRRAKMLRRHLTTAHNLTPDEYRSRWGLRPDYPMVSRNYSAQRSAFAKSIGLGTRRSGRRGGRRRQK
jgi:predicted transcriptional regulator